MSKKHCVMYTVSAQGLVGAGRMDPDSDIEAAIYGFTDIPSPLPTAFPCSWTGKIGLIYIDFAGVLFAELSKCHFS